MKFLVIFFVAFFGFLFSLNNLYQYYQTFVREVVEVERHFNLELGTNVTQVNAELYFGG